MALQTEHQTKIDELQRKAQRLRVQGLFTTQPGRGLTPELAALTAWEAGMIAVPTVSAMLERLERELETRELRYREQDRQTRSGRRALR